MVIRVGEQQKCVVASHQEPEASCGAVEHGGPLVNGHLVCRVRAGVHKLERLPSAPLIERPSDNDINAVVVILVLKLLAFVNAAAEPPRSYVQAANSATRSVSVSVARSGSDYCRSSVSPHQSSVCSRYKPTDTSVIIPSGLSVLRIDAPRNAILVLSSVIGPNRQRCWWRRACACSHTVLSTVRKHRSRRRTVGPRAVAPNPPFNRIVSEDLVW